MGSQHQSKVRQFRRCAHCPFVSQHWNRHLDSMHAGAPIVETEYVEKAKMPVDRHILPGWIVRFPSMSSGRSLIVLSVCFASVIRVPYIAHISLVDPSWSDVYGVIWSVVELNLGIVSACLPTLRPLFIHVFHGGYRPRTASPSSQSSVKTSTVIAEDKLSDIILITE